MDDDKLSDTSSTSTSTEEVIINNFVCIYCEVYKCTQYYDSLCASGWIVIINILYSKNFGNKNIGK